jgi:hypothetical protein
LVNGAFSQQLPPEQPDFVEVFQLPRFARLLQRGLCRFVAVSVFAAPLRGALQMLGGRRDRNALRCAATVMAVTKCPIPAHTVSEFTVPAKAMRQCGRTGRLDSPFAGLMEKITSKTTMQNSKASLKVRELKEGLSEEQLQNVYGGKASFHDLNFMHKLDKASPVLMPA